MQTLQIITSAEREVIRIVQLRNVPKLQLRDIRMSRSCFGISSRYFRVVSCILSGKEIIMRNK